MNTQDPPAKPLLDWYGVFASHRKLEPDGRIWSQEAPHGVELRIEPARKSPVLWTPRQSWERQGQFAAVTVLYDQGRYRLWYTISTPADAGHSLVCYAESSDGFAWECPELGLYEYGGSKCNNIVSIDDEHALGAVFVDPSAPPDERYKAVAPKGRYYVDGRLDPAMDKRRYKQLRQAMDLGEGGAAAQPARSLEIRQALHASVSPDGLRWRNLAEPVLDVGNTALDTHNLCTWDPGTGRYVAYLRGHLERRRLVRRAEGVDFRRLDPPRPCLACDTQDPVDDDIYNPCCCPYPGRPLYLMFPSIYHRIASTVDIQLAVSHDSYLWQRPERRPVIDLACEQGDYGTVYACPNLVATDAGEWRLAFHGSPHRHDFRPRGAVYPADTEYRWACWQEDRLAGLDAPGHGRVTLVERECRGQPMRLNYRTQADGWVEVELVHPPGTPPEPVEAFVGFSRAEADRLNGDELRRVITWRGVSDLSALRGQKVAVRLHLYRAKVFATAL